jgi:hypothetical protein
MALNYKKIPYRTEWLRFDEVGQKIKDLQVSLNLV